MKFYRLAGFFILLTAAFSACQKESRVIAKIGSLEISDMEFRRKLSEVAPEYQNYVMTPNGRRQFLDVLIREKMILSAAGDSEIQKSQPFKAEMEKLRVEVRQRLEEGREYLLTHLWIEDLRKKGTLSVTEEEVKQYYKQYPREVDIRHILLPTPEEAEAVLKKLRSGGSFAALAPKSLDAETRDQGGKMKPVLFGEIIPELEDVAFKTRTGEIIGPVRSKFGYHILRKETERVLSFDKVEERIRKILEKQKLDRHLQSLQSRYPVEVVDAQFQ